MDRIVAKAVVRERKEKMGDFSGQAVKSEWKTIQLTDQNMA
jgi:hypothetical protein